MPRERMSRSDRRASRGGGVHQLAWRDVTNPYRPVEVLPEEAVDAVHEASLGILERTGMDFLHPDAIGILTAHGGELEEGTCRVRIDRDTLMHYVALAPSTFRLHARNPAHDVTIGGNHVTFASVASAPNSSSFDAGRRPGTFEDFCRFLRLGQAFDIVHLFGGYPVEPVDLAPETRHLDALSAFVTLTDKVFHAYALGGGRILDAIEIVRIGRGVSYDDLSHQPSLFTIVNTSSPLRLDGPMIEGLIEMARMHQVVVITPFTLSGAMAPASLAGALALQNAEALAGIAFTQMVNPGTPVVYGGFTSNVDMRSGSPAFGTPEYTRAAMAGGQLARRYGLPYRSSNANAANAVDAQAAYESQMSLWGAVMGGANLVMHGAGWMEGGLVASFEKFVVDVEMLQMIAEFLVPVKVDEAELAVQAIADVGPGGHFFGSPHTLERYETAFYSPLLSDWRNWESWMLAGGVTVEWKANEVYKRVLNEFQAPPIEDSVRAELADFVGRRTAEGGVGSG